MSTSILDIHAYVEVSDPKQGLKFYYGDLGLSLKKQLSPRRLKLEGDGKPIYLRENRRKIAVLAQVPRVILSCTGRRCILISL